MRVYSTSSAVFPISRDPPEGGTPEEIKGILENVLGFQFLGIPPKGEPGRTGRCRHPPAPFPISRDPPEGGTPYTVTFTTPITSFHFLGIPPKGELQMKYTKQQVLRSFPISRDPPEGGTDYEAAIVELDYHRFPISRDPPEGGTLGGYDVCDLLRSVSNF